MFKWNLEKFKGFLVGACTVGLLFSVGTAYADGKLTTIKVVQGGIKLFVDGKLIKPTDSEGKVVEPFIYDGTTYLPLRALSNALTNYEKSVSWDAKTSSIYVGQAPVKAQTDFSEITPYAHSYTTLPVQTGERAAFKILDKTITPFNSLIGHREFVTFMLHSKYSSLDGQYIVPYTQLGSTDKGTIVFYNVDKKGYETEIARFDAEAGDEAIKVHVDLRGVEILKISSLWDGRLYNTTLAGINE
ncbi:hypothetical protein A7K91_14330 [Paenibacillus oryzae]|uniref:Copper amine oxidase-like N-terminal domain-containing protein n=1 Tax=Paenibacillus oryzae TaxID=1844972 RepID=A0A1A5YK20_9BACL|nr:hypothetical protein [Paenibacillus oryzae]OBR65735.1 hypothetical protein A7K91_14330 [Paenibacillus oryzae]